MPREWWQSAGALRPVSRAQHTFAATNPCHVYDLARALFCLGCLNRYHSGYPRWRLNPPLGFPLRTHSYRTLVTYGFQRIPQMLRPPDEHVFRWQDVGFDNAAAEDLEGGNIFHGIPGQCLECFRQARRQGMVTVLSHASGPVERQWALLKPEYIRMGVTVEDQAVLSGKYMERIVKERELTDYHCAASQIVRSQLIEIGIPKERIVVIPYGADPFHFYKREEVPSGSFRICFAGRHSLRKGLRVLLSALEAVNVEKWEAHFVGAMLRETEPLFSAYAGKTPLFRHGVLSQSDLGSFFRRMDLLVLPSVEEAFGLVVVQALNCGIPCVVSDRVGALDCVRPGETGTVVPFGDVEALAETLLHWSTQRLTVPDVYSWHTIAAKVAQLSEQWIRT